MVWLKFSFNHSAVIILVHHLMDRVTIYSLTEWGLKLNRRKPNRTKKNCRNKGYLEHQKEQYYKYNSSFSPQDRRDKPVFWQETHVLVCNYSGRWMGYNLQIEMHNATLSTARACSEFFASRRRSNTKVSSISFCGEISRQRPLKKFRAHPSLPPSRRFFKLIVDRKLVYLASRWTPIFAEVANVSWGEAWKKQLDRTPVSVTSS